MMKSFNKVSAVCEEHVQDEETKKCYCELTGELCNTYNCPKVNWTGLPP